LDWTQSHFNVPPPSVHIIHQKVEQLEQVERELEQTVEDGNDELQVVVEQRDLDVRHWQAAVAAAATAQH